MSKGSGISREELIYNMAGDMAGQLPPLFDTEALILLYPTDYHESMNTVLVQEAERYNKVASSTIVDMRQLKILFSFCKRCILVYTSSKEH